MTLFLSDHTRDFVQYYFDLEQNVNYARNHTNVNFRQLQRMHKFWKECNEIVDFCFLSSERFVILQTKHHQTFLFYLQNRSTIYLNEMIWFFFDEYDVLICEITIWYSLHRIDWTRKRSSKIIKERNVYLRFEWTKRIEDWSIYQMIFLNEFVVHERTNDRKFDWKSRDLSFIEIQFFKRNKKWNIFFVFTMNDFLIYKLHHDNIIIAIYNDFIRNDVFFHCSIDDDFRNVIVMNNARIHHNDELIVMCDEINVTLIYLFFYSSNYNSIEISFAIFKIWIKRNEHVTMSYTLNIDEFNEYFHDAMNAVQKNFMICKNRAKNSENLFRLTDFQYS